MPNDSQLFPNDSGRAADHAFAHAAVRKLLTPDPDLLAGEQPTMQSAEEFLASLPQRVRSDVLTTWALDMLVKAALKGGMAPEFTAELGIKILRTCNLTAGDHARAVFDAYMHFLILRAANGS